MTKAIKFAFAVAALFAAGGCAAVTSHQAGWTNATGETWFTEGKTLGPMVLSSKVYYCPAPTAKGPAQCTEATIQAAQ